MAKSDPMRLDETLVNRAKRAAHVQHRSSAKQIEHWAELGRRVERIVGLDEVADLLTGKVTLNIEQVTVSEIEPDALFAEVDTERDSGRLAGRVSSAPYQYQASRTHPGCLERLGPNSEVSVGQYVNGQFRKFAAAQT